MVFGVLVDTLVRSLPPQTDNYATEPDVVISEPVLPTCKGPFGFSQLNDLYLAAEHGYKHSCYISRIGYLVEMWYLLWMFEVSAPDAVSEHEGVLRPLEVVVFEELGLPCPEIIDNRDRVTPMYDAILYAVNKRREQKVSRQESVDLLAYEAQLKSRCAKLSLDDKTAYPERCMRYITCMNLTPQKNDIFGFNYQHDRNDGITGLGGGGSVPNV